ncbi:MAG: helix-turn-helix domain-containing protein [Candidatus Moranbacteria bacterium]|nr:helix-turn-helix domain-containing protein [Candidatus Moranbacteria bacterium]NTW90143.1 helix-turn-helix domain-containing protein [Candidatus Moranbacteria bacterium]
MTAANFTRKRVGSLTLGEKLRKVRNDNRISLAEVSRATKIQVKYLEALEAGAYEKLPPEVYVRGFLRGYAAHLGIPEDAILRLYERERSIRKNLGKTEAPARFQLGGGMPIRIPLSPRGVVVSVIALVIVGFFSYLFFEFRSFVSEPRLVILSPSDGDTVAEAEVLVRGETDPRAEVRINGEGTTVDERGAFSEGLSLDSGLNVITISSTNRFGKTRERTVSVNAALPERTDEGGALMDPTPPPTVHVTLRTVRSTSVSVGVDGVTVWSGKLPVGEEKTFDARERVEVSSDEGNAVMIREGDTTEAALSGDARPAMAVFGSDGRK